MGPKGWIFITHKVRSLTVLLLVTLAITPVFSTVAFAQETPLTGDALYWRQQNIADFERWRETIPDYEKRLYDRVKGLNKRVIRLTNITIAGFVVMLAVVFMVFARVIHSSRGAGVGSPQKSNQGGEAVDQKLGGLAARFVGSFHHHLYPDTPEQRIRKSQKKMKKAISSLLYYQTERAENDIELSGAIERADRSIQKIEEKITAIDDKPDPDPGGTHKALRKNQKNLQRTLKDLYTFARDSASQAENLSMLTEKAKRALEELDGQLTRDLPE